MNDPGRWVALALAAALVVLASLSSGIGGRPSARTTTLIAALAATALSALYIPAYLRGGPRIIDATAYWLEARALAEGHLAWPIGDPESAVAGRFLVRDTLAAIPGGNVAVLFPPGYPAVLALGFLVHAPLAVGPILAGLVTLATAKLARALADEVALPSPRADAVEASAAILSAASATLRYHTADTMSHGLAALCFTAAILGAIRVVRADGLRRTATAALLLGASSGLLLATRPVSAIACALTVLFVLGAALARRRRGTGLDARRAATAIAVSVIAAAPFIALLLLHQRAATGAWLRSAQDLYYAESDGPPGCFRYGFGAGIGCRLEHGPYVDAVLPDGYGLMAALHTTGVRLWVHAGDTLNLFALGPLVAACVLFAARTSGLRVLALGPVLLVAAYAPFYFDGSYPGGGARFYVDALPLELVAIAFAVCALVERVTRRADGDARARWLARAPLALGALSLVGFAARGGTEHALLRDRDGGAPMFDAAFVERELHTRGPEAQRAVVFIASDHGFNLAFDPDSSLGTSRADHDVARVRGDALDALALDAFAARHRATGGAVAFRYEHAPDGAPPRLVPYAPSRDVPIEGEALYPPVDQVRGWSFTREAPGASDGREFGVALEEGRARITLALPSALAGRRIAPIVRGAGRLVVRAATSNPIADEVVAEWVVAGCDDDLETAEPVTLRSSTPEPARLRDVPTSSTPGSDRARLRLEIETDCPRFALDAIRATWADSPEERGRAGGG